jgi:hypothetical protein
MKFGLGAAVLLLMIGAAAAGQNPGGMGKWRLADAASDACLANCASQNNSCKRVCPVTLNTPCLSACDSQAQTCRQGCQSR